MKRKNMNVVSEADEIRHEYQQKNSSYFLQKFFLKKSIKMGTRLKVIFTQLEQMKKLLNENEMTRLN